MTNTRRMPEAIYAAAGAGDLAYRQLSEFSRQLPAKAAELRDRVVALRPSVADAVREPGRKVDVDKIRAAVDVDKIRAVARRNATALKDQAQAAQERAAKVYARLVAHGEKVVDGPRVKIERVAPAAVAAPVTPSATPAAAPAGAAKGGAKVATKKTGPAAR